MTVYNDDRILYSFDFGDGRQKT